MIYFYGCKCKEAKSFKFKRKKYNWENLYYKKWLRILGFEDSYVNEIQEIKVEMKIVIWNFILNWKILNIARCSNLHFRLYILLRILILMMMLIKNKNKNLYF